MTNAAHPKTGRNLPKEGNAAFPSGRIQGSPTFTGDRMRSILAAALLCAPAFAQTQMIAKRGDDFVKLSEKPCEVASVLRFIRPEARDQHRRADTQMGGQKYFACYVVRAANVLLIDEDGDTFAVPVDEFKPEEGV